MTPSADQRYPATRRVVEFVSSFELSRGDPALVPRAKALLVDHLAVLLASVATGELADWGRALPAGASTIAGSPQGVERSWAALVNGALAHALEFDDATLSPVGHPSCTILPVLFALAEEHRLAPSKLLEAYLVGLEVHARVGSAQVGNWRFEGGWLPIGHIGVIGAVAAGAKLLDLDPAQTTAALGIGGSLGGHLAVASGTAAKPLGAGNAARTALHAVELARLGHSGPPAILERPGGFGDMFFGEHDFSLLAAIGEPHHLVQTGVAIKQFPSCYGCHWGADALADLVARHRVHPAEVRAVHLACPASAMFLDRPEPRTVDDARFSHQYNLALTVIDGWLTQASFDERRLADPSVRDMVGRVSVEAHPEGLAPPACWRHVVTLTTAAGRFESSVSHPRGHPRRPLTEADLEAKFRRCAPTLDRAQVDALLGRLWAFDELADLSQVTSVLRASPSPAGSP